MGSHLVGDRLAAGQRPAQFSSTQLSSARWCGLDLIRTKKKKKVTLINCGDATVVVC
jgi:hypothetical protein